MVISSLLSLITLFLKGLLKMKHLIIESYGNITARGKSAAGKMNSIMTWAKLVC